jgi:DNA polymerase
MGYQGGVGGLLVFLLGFNINLDELTVQVTPLIPEDVYEEAEKFYEWMNDMDVKTAKDKAKKAGTPEAWEEYYDRKRTYDLPPETHKALESLKRLWRRGHPATVKFWKDCDTAVRNAIHKPNHDFHFGKCAARRTGKWVRIILPSGHNIVYPGMRINDEGKIVFRGVNQFTKKWGDIETHGGRMVENCCHAFARDVFKYGQLNAAKKGYNLVLPVHDELVCEVPDTGEYTLAELRRIMSIVPPWATGMPLAASGFEDYRYHK